MLKNMKYISGSERRRVAGASFMLPTQAQLDTLKVGSYVKVGLTFVDSVLATEAGGERFWVKLTKIDGINYEGITANKLLVVPIGFHTPVQFVRDNILDI